MAKTPKNKLTINQFVNPSPKKPLSIIYRPNNVMDMDDKNVFSVSITYTVRGNINTQTELADCADAIAEVLKRAHDEEEEVVESMVIKINEVV